MNGTAGKPDTERIARTAEGPGIASTACPAAAAAATSRSPGSETSGVPASETSARVSPASRRRRASRDAGVLVVAVAGDARRREAVAREEVPRAPRVLAVDDGGRRESVPRPRATGPRDSRSASRRRGGGPCPPFSQRGAGGARDALLRIGRRVRRVARAVLAVVAPRCRPPGATRPRPSAAASTTPSGPSVVLDRIAAVVGDDVVLESEIRKLAGVGYLPRRAGEIRRRLPRPRPLRARRGGPARAAAPQDGRASSRSARRSRPASPPSRSGS